MGLQNAIQMMSLPEIMLHGSQIADLPVHNGQYVQGFGAFPP